MIFKCKWAGLGLAALWLAAVCAAPAAAQNSKASSVYGKLVAASYDLPADQLEKFNKFVAKPPPKTGSPLENMLLADDESWSGPEIKLGTSGNPYVTVIHATVTAVADGDVTSVWDAGWAWDGSSRSALVSPLAQLNARAGQVIALQGAAAPLSFKEDRSVQSVVSLKSSKNLKFTAVRVEVWSGIGKSSWLQRFGAFGGVLTGLVMLAVIFWMRRS
ncbi:MAG: hypothetical protein ACKVOO_11680 [Burkholderiaceae bacterium]